MNRQSWTETIAIYFWLFHYHIIYVYVRNTVKRYRELWTTIPMSMSLNAPSHIMSSACGSHCIVVWLDLCYQIRMKGASEKMQQRDVNYTVSIWFVLWGLCSAVNAVPNFGGELEPQLAEAHRSISCSLATLTSQAQPGRSFAGTIFNPSMFRCPWGLISFRIFPAASVISS